MFKRINICWVTAGVSKHQAVAMPNLSPALWPDEYFITLYQVKQLSAWGGPGLLSLSFPRIRRKPADQSTFPRETSWFSWAEEGIEPGWVTLLMPCYRGGCCFASYSSHVLVEPVVSSTGSHRVHRRRPLNDMGRERKINTSW